MWLTENMLGILVAVIILLIYIRVKKRLSYFTDRGFPQVPLTWTNFFKSFMFSYFFSQPAEVYEKTKGLDSSYVGYFMALLKPSVLIRDPSLVESVLIKDFSYFQDHGFDIDFKRNPIAGHLFNMKGDQWRTLRHKLVPTFTSGKLRGMVPLMEECADKLVLQINQNPRLKKETNLKELFKKYSIAVIASTTFGIEPESISDPNCQFMRVLEDVVGPGLNSRLRFSLSLIFPKLVNLLKIKMFSQEAEDLMLTLTKESLEMRKKSGVKRNDFIQLLLELKEKGSVELDVKDLEQDEKDTIANMETQPTSMKLEFTYELLAAQVFVFLIGGFENIAFLVALTTYVLSKHPDVQSRAREEVKQAKAKHNGIDYNALRDMKLLGACMDEALRLYPPVGVVIRESNKPYTFNDGGKVDKGTTLVIPAKSFHRDSKYWEDPEQFKPERFLGDGIRPGIYMPFGDGPRICIAQRLALLQSKLMVAKLLLNYDLQPSSKTMEPVKLEVQLGADNKGGFWGSFKDLHS